MTRYTTLRMDTDKHGIQRVSVSYCQLAVL